MMKPLDEDTIHEKSTGDSDSEMLNLEKELYSLTHYADDVEELVSQMFSSIKGAKLQAMLPPILKEIPFIDVQQLCLHELRGMSSRRILSIINGVEMSDSSSEEDDDLVDRNSKCEADEKNSKEFNSESVDMESLKDLSLADDPLLTALDVRQLEMRAKLIKNMLSKQPGEDSGEEEKDENEFPNLDPNIKIKEEPLSSDEEASKKSKRSRRRRSSSSGSSRSSRSSSNSSSSYSSYSSKGSHSSDSDKLSHKSNQEDSPNTKKHKKKISKKEFEARMKKARMNRTYRKRKDSDDDSANESRRRHRRKKKLEKDQKESTPELKETSKIKENGVLKEDLPEKEMEIEKPEESMENEQEVVVANDINEEKEIEDPTEEGEVNEVLEKEEGEIDSNEENYYSDSRSSSYSSRSYSSSPKRHRRHKRKSRRRTRTPPIPKVPNWEAGSKSALPKKNVKSIEESKSLPLAPLTEDRQSVSFSLSKKNGSSIVALDATLHDDSGNKKSVGENTLSAGTLPLSKKKDTATISKSESQEIPQKKEESSAEMVYEISGSDEDGLLQDNSDGDLQEDSVIDPIQNLELGDGSAPNEEESLDVSEALEDISTSEVLAEDTSQDVLEPDEEDDIADEQQTTEIIGVIDPMDDNATSAFNEVSNSSWSTRWLQSEKVQQVVSDSKMLSKMRKNIQAKGKTKVKKAPLSAAIRPALAADKVKVSKVDLKLNKRVIGGIGGNAEDYENMFGIKVKVPQSLPIPKPMKPLPAPAPVEPQAKTKSLASALLDSDDDDDDSEDDELWSKIMKK